MTFAAGLVDPSAPMECPGASARRSGGCSGTIYPAYSGHSSQSFEYSAGGADITPSHSFAPPGFEHVVPTVLPGCVVDLADLPGPQDGELAPAIVQAGATGAVRRWDEFLHLLETVNVPTAASVLEQGARGLPVWEGILDQQVAVTVRLSQTLSLTLTHCVLSITLNASGRCAYIG